MFVRIGQNGKNQKYDCQKLERIFNHEKTEKYGTKMANRQTERLGD